jgi:hypothetical protein
MSRSRRQSRHRYGIPPDLPMLFHLLVAFVCVQLFASGKVSACRKLLLWTPWLAIWFPTFVVVRIICLIPFSSTWWILCRGSIPHIPRIWLLHIWICGSLGKPEQHFANCSMVLNYPWNHVQLKAEPSLLHGPSNRSHHYSELLHYPMNVLVSFRATVSHEPSCVLLLWTALLPQEACAAEGWDFHAILSQRFKMQCKWRAIVPMDAPRGNLKCWPVGKQSKASCNLPVSSSLTVAAAQFIEFWMSRRQVSFFAFWLHCIRPTSTTLFVLVRNRWWKLIGSLVLKQVCLYIHRTDNWIIVLSMDELSTDNLV